MCCGRCFALTSVRELSRHITTHSNGVFVCVSVCVCAFTASDVLDALVSNNFVIRKENWTHRGWSTSTSTAHHRDPCGMEHLYILNITNMFTIIITTSTRSSAVSHSRCVFDNARKRLHNFILLSIKKLLLLLLWPKPLLRCALEIAVSGLGVAVSHRLQYLCNFIIAHIWKTSI